MGGLAAGILIAILYYYNNVIVAKHQIELITLPLAVAYASLAVGGLGGCALQAGIQGFRALANARGYPRFLFNAVTGGLLCGAVVGSLVGAFGGWLFGRIPEDYVGTDTVWWPAALGAICFVLGTLSLKFQTWGQFLRALVLVAALAGAALVEVLRPERFFFDDETTPQMTLGGLLLGLPVGLLCRAEVGIALLLYHWWERARTAVGVGDQWND